MGDLLPEATLLGQVLGEELPQQDDGLEHLGPTQRVEHAGADTTARDDAAVAKDGQVLTDVGLGQVQRLAQVAHAELAVVDLRERVAYASGHLEGSIGIVLGDQFSTCLGWSLPWGSSLTLVGESPEQVTDAQRQLVRIGIDRPDAAAVGTTDELGGSSAPERYDVATFADLADLTEDARAEITVLDARRDDERAAGHIPGSAHIRSMPCSAGSTRCRRARRGSTARVGTAPRSPRASSPAPVTT